jgi:hypothetical protein
MQRKDAALKPRRYIYTQGGPGTAAGFFGVLWLGENEFVERLQSNYGALPLGENEERVMAHRFIDSFQ